MGTTTLDNRNNNGLLILIAVAIIAAIALGMLELSGHAAQGRAGAMDATEIRSLIVREVCKPVKAYTCPVHNQAKVICKLKGDLWGGLILGTTVEPPIIVTGYLAPYSYWMGTVVRDECVEVGWSGL
jgi:hypothetical protein